MGTWTRRSGRPSHRPRGRHDAGRDGPTGRGVDGPARLIRTWRTQLPDTGPLLHFDENQRQHVVFILGAGASKLAGVPLTHEFLDAARRLFAADRFPNERQAFTTVFEMIHRLQAVHSKAQMDLVNVESVFSAFETARLLGGFGFGRTPEELEYLIQCLQTVIARTIEESLALRRAGEAESPTPSPYMAFAHLLQSLRESQPSKTIGIISFNYDVALDYVLDQCRRGVGGFPRIGRFDYGLGGIEDGANEVPYLKLHGSLNWGSCYTPGCHAITPHFAWHLAETEPNSREYRLLLQPEAGSWECESCQEAVVGPVLVPPTWNKTSYHSSISRVWERAATELRMATDIVLIGYSLPPTDEFFRHLFAIGTLGGPPLRSFLVVNTDHGDDYRRRIESVIGPGVINRLKFLNAGYHQDHQPLSFSDAVNPHNGVYDEQKISGCLG